MQTVWNTAFFTAAAALACYLLGRIRRDGETTGRMDARSFAGMLGAAASAGCVAFCLRLHNFYVGESVAVGLAWALVGPVWRGAMGRWRIGVAVFVAAFSLACASYWYADRSGVEWLLTAILVAAYLSVFELLGLAYVVGLLMLAHLHAPEVFANERFGLQVLAACLPGFLTWLGISLLRDTAAAGPLPVSSHGAIPGLSLHLRRINHDFGFLATAAIFVGVPFMTNQVWPMSGMETGTWLALLLVILTTGIYSLATRPLPGLACRKNVMVQAAIVVALIPYLLLLSLSDNPWATQLVYQISILVGGALAIFGLVVRPRSIGVAVDDARIVSLHILLMFPIAYGWSWMIRGVRSDAQWWVAFLLPMMVWVARRRQ